MDKLVDLLNAYGFYYTKEELAQIKKDDAYIELVKKAYGDSHGLPTEIVFADDYQELEELCDSLGFEFSSSVWYD